MQYRGGGMQVAIDESPTKLYSTPASGSGLGTAVALGPVWIHTLPARQDLQVPCRALDKVIPLQYPTLTLPVEAERACRGRRPQVLRMSRSYRLYGRAAVGKNAYCCPQRC